MTPDRRMVVGAIIVDNMDTPQWVLAARRTGPAELAGLWEFPGGKVEPGEGPEKALEREIHEELGVKITVGTELPHASGAWPVSEKYELRLYFAAVTVGEPRPGDSHDKVLWLDPPSFDLHRWLPSDTHALSAVRQRLANWSQNVPVEDLP